MRNALDQVEDELVLTGGVGIVAGLNPKLMLMLRVSWQCSSQQRPPKSCRKNCDDGSEAGARYLSLLTTSYHADRSTQKGVCLVEMLGGIKLWVLEK